MKMRVPILFLLVVSGGFLVWLLSSTHREATPPPTPSWAEQIDVLNELGRYKHATAAEYAHFATAADAEQQTDAARLFRALARSEQAHEIGCADAVRRLGGRYTPPLKVIVFRGPTHDNLLRAFEEEQQNYDRYRSGTVEQAIASGNRYAARTIIRIAGGDMRQTELLEHFIEHPDNTGYAVCPSCGNIWSETYCDHYCPFCLTREQEFIRFR